MTDPIAPHQVEWTPEQVKRFWDYYSTNPALEDTYFARMAGDSLISYVRKRIDIGTAVDIGCGPGDLVRKLMAAGSQAYAVDASPASVEKVNRLFAGEPLFRGAAVIAGRIDLPDDLADSAFMLEVVEHMRDPDLASALTEARRILKPGGFLVLTTPNEEDLEANQTMCPECGGIYHRIQHVRSWSAESLRGHVEPFGFDTVSCEGTYLATKGLKGHLRRLFHTAALGLKPHLVYIGKSAP